LKGVDDGYGGYGVRRAVLGGMISCGVYMIGIVAGGYMAFTM